jgi:hypothetical protein
MSVIDAPADLWSIVLGFGMATFQALAKALELAVRY